MILAFAALLLQPLAIPQNLIAPVATLASSAGADSRSASQPADAAPAEPLLLPEFKVPGVTLAPERTAPEEVSPSTPVTVIVVPVPADSPDLPVAAEPAEPAGPAIVAVRPHAVAETQRSQQRRLWLTLSMAQHSAAAFDAWSTRRVITSGAGQELNPMLRPFAGNASLYAAIQVGPLLLDYVSHRMMTSRHGWERHTWWLPQTLGTAMSVASGAHNLGLHAAN
jgi:hypothetical protein